MIKSTVLFSGGKDSNYSLFQAKKQGHKIKCSIYLKSENLDSYMFQSLGREFIEKQAKSLNISLLVFKTKGIEEELKDLQKAIKTAKEKYKIDCVIRKCGQSKIIRNFLNKKIQKRV